MKMKLILLLCFIVILTSCTDAKRSKLIGFGDEYKIEMIGCDGKIIRTWFSSGKVLSEETSDGYYFNEKKY